MPIPVTCPGCSAKMKAPDGAAGKKIKCPKCQQAFTVPAAEPASDFEVVEDEPAPVKKPAPAAAKPKAKADVEVDEDEEDARPKKKPARAVADDDDEDEKPKKKKVVAAEEDEDEDDKPRKKSKAAAEDDEDEDEDEKPKKKKKKKRSGDDDEEKKGVSMVRNIIMGSVLVILLGVVGFVYWQKFGKKDEATANNSSGGDTPAGPSGQQPSGGPSALPGPKLPNGGPGPKLPGPGGNTGPQVSVKLRDAEMGAPVLTPDGKLLLAQYAVGESLRLGIWDVQTGSQFASIGDDKHDVNAYGISPNRKQVAIVSSNAKALTLWSCPTGQLQKTVNLTQWKDGTRTPSFATYTPDGTAILTAYEGALLRVEPETGKQEELLKGVDTLRIRYSPEANRVIDIFYNAGSNKTELRVIDPAKPSTPTLLPLGPDEAPQDRPDISADGKTAAAIVLDRTDFQNPKTAIHLYDVDGQKLKAKIPLSGNGGAKDQLKELRISPDGSHIVYGIRRVRDGKATEGCFASDASGQNPRQLGEWTGNSIQTTAFSRDGKTIAVVNGRLRVYDIATGKDMTP